MAFSDNGPIRFTLRYDPLPQIADKRALQFGTDRGDGVLGTLRIPASMFEYRCPFDFIHEHERWFEFHRRLYFDKEPSHSIICSMLNDD